MKQNIKKTFVTLAMAFVVLLALSLPAFSQFEDTCTPIPETRENSEELKDYHNGFSGGVYERDSNNDHILTSPIANVYVEAIDQSTGETFYDYTDSDGIFGRSGTGGVDLSPNPTGTYINEGQWEWTRLSDNAEMKFGLRQCHYYTINVSVPFPQSVQPNPFTAFVNGYWNGIQKIYWHSFGVR